MAISTNGTVLTRLAGALYNTQMSNSTYAEVAALDPSSLANALYARDFASKTDAQVATTLVTNLGLTSITGLNNWIAAQLTAAGSAKGAKIVEMLNSFAQMTADTTYGSFATAFNTKVDTALALSQTVGYKGGDFVTGPVVVVPGATFGLTTGVDTVPTTASNDTVTGVISATSTSTTFNATDVVIDTSSTDADSFTITTEADITSSNTGLVRGFETVNVNANATTLTDTNLDFAATNFAGVKTFNFDVTKPVTAVSGLVVTALDINNATVNTSDDFVTASVAGSTGKNLNVNASAVGTSGSPTGITITGAMGDVTVTGVGHLSVTSNASTGLLSATAAKNLTVSGTAAQIISATATAGNVTVSDATASLSTTVVASGDVTVAKLDAAGKLNVTAGGTITLTGSTLNNTDLDITSATLSSVGSSSIADADAITNLTLSGNGGKATYTMTAGSAALADVNVTGSSDVVLKLSAASVEAGSAVLNVNDTGSGVFNLELGTTAGTVDLRGGSVDKLTVAIDNENKVLSVKSGQVVTYKVAQTDGAGAGTTTLEVGTNANAASNTVTIKLDDEVKDASAVAITKLTVTQAKNVTVDASVDATAGGSAVTHTIGALIASGANSNVTVNAGANNISLEGTSTVGTGTVTFTGSGTITDTTASITATTIDASAVTGKITLDGTTLSASTIRTGSKDDIVVLTSTTLDQTVSTGAGDDTVTLAALDGTKIVSIDLGEGTNDRLKFTAANTKLIGTSASITGVETIEFANEDGQQIKAALLNGATYKIDATAANGKSVAVIVDAADKAVDLSKLVGSLAAETAVAGMTFATDANANTAAITITGATGAKNNITGSSSSGDVLTGGTKADTFNYGSIALFMASGAMLDTIDGGSGTSSPSSTTQLTDTINFTSTAGGTISATDSFAKASNVESIAVTAAATTAYSFTLGATAQTAGITSVDLSGDSDATGTNVVNVSAFTRGVTIKGSIGADNITGSAAADTVTAGAGTTYTDIDTISTGDGDDTIVLRVDAEIGANSTAALVDSINGGAGTDTLQVGTSGTTLTIAVGQSFARMSNVEVIKAAANTAAVSITTHANVYDAGVRTIDLSAVTAATSNVINVDEFIADQNTTLIGSATGVTTFTGGAGADAMKGGSANDVFTGKEGADTIDMTLGGTDVVDFGTALADGIQTVTGFTAGTTSVPGYDTIKSLAGTNLVDAPAIGSNAVVIADGKISEFNLIFTGTGLAGVADGTALLTALAAQNSGTAVTLTSTAGAGAVGYMVAYQANNAYIYYFNNAATNGIVASEIGLVGVLNGVAAGALVQN